MIRSSAIVAATCAALAFVPTSGRAQTAPATQYHVVQDTFGCVSQEATRTLTGPDAPQNVNSAAFKTAFSNGRCVTITPRSPWALISRDGDVALMSYAGTIGAPGSYYLRVDLLVDPEGRHPGDAQGTTAPASPAAGSSQTAPAPDQTGASALAPQPLITGQPSGPALAAGDSTSPWARVGWLMLLVAIIAGAVFLAWRSSPVVAGKQRRSPGCPLHLPDHVMAEAKRLAEANGVPLDQFLATLIAERIGEMKAASSQAKSQSGIGREIVA